MKLVELKCKNCGAVLKVQADSINIHCDHCKTSYKLDDEAQHIKYDEMEKAGYDYEKGRLRAKQEHEEEKARKKQEAQQAAIKAERDRKMRVWLILAWIFLFPFTLTWWIWAKSNWDKKVKIIVTVIMWTFFLIVSYGNNAADTSTTTDRSNNSGESSIKIGDSSDEAKWDYMDAMRKCTVTEAADIYNIGIGQKSSNIFNDARETCEGYYKNWSEKDFYEAVYTDWENRKNETIDGKNLEYYLEILGW